MTSAAIRTARPTRAERAVLSVAASLTGWVDRRTRRRAARGEIARDLMREQRARRLQRLRADAVREHALQQARAEAWTAVTAGSRRR